MKNLKTKLLLGIFLFTAISIGQNSPPMQSISGQIAVVDRSPGVTEQMINQLANDQINLVDQATILPIPAEEIALLIETFGLLDQIACLAPDFDFYLNMNKEKYGCIVELEMIQVNTNITRIANQCLKIILWYASRYGINIEEALTGVTSQLIEAALSYVGIEIPDAQIQPVEVQDTPADYIRLINEELQHIIVIMGGVNSKYRNKTLHDLKRKVDAAMRDETQLFIVKIP